MAKIKVKQIKSAINRPKRQKLTLQALGLGKLNRIVEHEATPQILGMVKTVEHLIAHVRVHESNESLKKGNLHKGCIMRSVLDN